MDLDTQLALRFEEVPLEETVVIVTGSRNWQDSGSINRVLNEYRPKLIVQGGARGADELAREWARINDVPCETFNANWQHLGRRAGMERNTRMLMAYPHAHVVAFPLDGPGTRHCIAEARRLGMRVDVHVAGQLALPATERRLGGAR